MGCGCGMVLQDGGACLLSVKDILVPLYVSSSN